MHLLKKELLVFLLLLLHNLEQVIDPLDFIIVLILVAIPQIIPTALRKARTRRHLLELLLLVVIFLVAVSLPLSHSEFIFQM